MTTGWSAARIDPAPRIAYELCAAVADDDQAMTDKIWDGLDLATRARVVAALGAQARYTATAAADAAGISFLSMMASDVRTRLRYCDARDEVLLALAGHPARLLPACDGCSLPAVALAMARLLVMTALGYSRAQSAEVCRRGARR